MELEPPACGTVAALADDFNDGAVAHFWAYFNDDAVQREEANGVLRFTLANGVSGNHYAGYRQLYPAPLGDAPISVKLVEAPDPAPSGEAALALHAVDGHAVSIVYSGGMLVAQDWVPGGTFVATPLVPFSAGTMSHWRLRPAGDVLHVETSGDGVDGTSRHVSSSAPYQSLVTVSLQAGTYQSEDNPGFAAFDDFNGCVPQVPFCPIRTLTDGFDGAALDEERWRVHSWSACSATVGDGALRVTCPNGSFGSGVSVRTRAAYDLRDDALVVRVPASPTHPAGGSHNVKVRTSDDAHYFEMGESEARIYGFAVANGAVLSWNERSLAQNPRPEAWRVKHSGDQVCLSWQQVGATAFVDVVCLSDDEWDPSATYVELNYWPQATLDADGTALFDAVNP